MKQWLEMEIGITGGEEDGVNNEDVDNNSLYTQPEDIYGELRGAEGVCMTTNRIFRDLQDTGANLTLLQYRRRFW
jgi:hypothetical protein